MSKNIPDRHKASLTTIGETQLTSSLYSESEEMAATPKAVFELNKRLELVEKNLDTLYHIGEEYVFTNVNEVPIGFEEKNGALLTNASSVYKHLWEFLRQAKNSWMVVTEEEWHELQAETIALSNGTYISKWNGVGGVTKYVVDINANTIRLPDVRGMFAGARGYEDIINTGDTHGDEIRNITGTISSADNYELFLGHSQNSSGSLYHTTANSNQTQPQQGVSLNTTIQIGINTSRQVPTGPVIRPRGYGVLVCVYTGADI